jgi:antitoxin PrlF
MIISKLTSKAQTTIPQPVRAALHLVGGDELAYEIDGARVILTKASHRNAEDDFDAFTEWDSEADRNAYAGLSAGRSLSSS